jgi:phosphatidylglycerol:prolipoprotein diacylglycerol transferase
VWPIFTHLGGHEIGTFGVVVALGLLLSLWIARRLGERDGLDPRKVNDIGLLAMVAAMAGSRLLAAAVALLSGAPFGWDELRTAGAIHGALLGALLAILVLSRTMQIPLDRLLDAYVPAAAFGQAVGRLGCFAAGCCFGASTDLPWAVTFADTDALRLGGVPLGVPVHPVQLYDAALHFLMCAGLIFLHRRKILVGRLFAPWCILEGCVRILVEGARGDVGRGVWLGLDWLSTGRVTSILMIVLGLLVLYRVDSTDRSSR